MRGIIITNYRPLMHYHLFPSSSYFYDVIQLCVLLTCKDYRIIILLKNRTLMFRCIFLEINDGASCDLVTNQVPFYSNSVNNLDFYFRHHRLFFSYSVTYSV